MREAIKKPAKRPIIWMLIAAGVVTALALWYFLQPLQRIVAISCERITPGSIGTCARIIHTYNRTGLSEQYEVELTPTSDGEFQGGSRSVVRQIDPRCGQEFASASWTAEALVVQSDTNFICNVDRTVIGSWL